MKNSRYTQPRDQFKYFLGIPNKTHSHTHTNRTIQRKVSLRKKIHTHTHNHLAPERYQKVVLGHVHDWGNHKSTER